MGNILSFASYLLSFLRNQQLLRLNNSPECNSEEMEEKESRSKSNTQNRSKEPPNDTELIDEGLYSRQLYVLGTDGMQRITKSDILIFGLNGLGLEIAKNIVLAGARSVTLYDPEPLTWSDLSTHFFSGPEDVGRPRADVSRPKLAELNNHVTVEVLHNRSNIDRDDLSRFTLVILTQASHDLCLELGDCCHDLGVKLIVANTCGLFGRIFCDFGDNFIVADPTGREFEPLIIEHIEKSEQGLVTCSKNAGSSSLSDSSMVTFSQIVGMTELNDCEPRRVTVHSPTSFAIGDTSSYSDYISGGICTPIRIPKRMHFLSYREAYRQPRFETFDFVKIARAKQLHLCFAGLNEYRKTPEHRGCFPAPWNRHDARTFLDLLGQVNASHLADCDAHVTEIDEQFGTLFSFICVGQCSPMQAVIGGIAAQEAMKACTGKFNPIQQWCYVDASECLPSPENYDLLTEDEVRPQQTRYDGQVAIFGHTFQQRLLKAHYFMPGAGAIGCELLKNFALMGVGASPAGKITVTDMDSIERSNLNRQFLFRSRDISKMKALVAADAIRQINPQMNIDAHTNRVGAETEHIYNDAFFDTLDGVVNALDNVETRQYIDLRCLYYRKPSIDSGTMGTVARVKVMIPHVTDSYSSEQSVPEDRFPVCTLKSFPYLIQHTLQWARDLFEGLYVQQSRSLDSYMRDPTKFVQDALTDLSADNLEMLETLLKNVTDERPHSFEDCVTWARLLWQELYVNSIVQILHIFPPEHVTESGARFWSGSKRCPHPLEFDANNPLHMDFIVSAANLRAHMFNIQAYNHQPEIISILRSVRIPETVPRDDVAIPTSDEEPLSNNLESSALDFDKIENICEALENPAEPHKFPINVIEFEKDDDSNFHVDFITAASNLRAINYGIPTADRLKSKRIAGNIIPAIATTTSLVAGFVCLELYKLVQGHRSLSLYREAYIDLAVPQFTLFEPTPAPKMKYGNMEYTIWDRFEFVSPMTLQQLIEYFKNKHDLNVVMLIHRSCILYAFYLAGNESDTSLSMPLEQLTERLLEQPIASHQRALVFHVRCTDQTGGTVELPYIRYDLRRPQDQ